MCLCKHEENLRRYLDVLSCYNQIRLLNKSSVYMYKHVLRLKRRTLILPKGK